MDCRPRARARRVRATAPSLQKAALGSHRIARVLALSPIEQVFASNPAASALAALPGHPRADAQESAAEKGLQRKPLRDAKKATQGAQRNELRKAAICIR